MTYGYVPIQSREERELIRKILSGDPTHEHSSAEQDNEKFIVTVCDDHQHMALSFLACCVDYAHDYAESFFVRNLSMTVDVVDIWDQADVKMGEPGETYYPDDHRMCPKEDHSKCDKLDWALYCHRSNTDIKVGVK